MHELRANLMWIGNALDARDPRQVLDNEISAIVDLAYEEAAAQLPRQLTYCRFPLNDGGGNPVNLIVQALQTTTGLIRKGIPTLVSCSAGMSRSPTIAAFALALLDDKEPRICIAEIGRIRSLELKPQLWADVENAFQIIQSQADSGFSP